MKKFITIYIFVITTITSFATSFDNILNTVANNNPTLAASIAQGNAEIISMKTSNNLPDPEIDFEHKWGAGGTKWGLGVSQSFEWPGIYSSRKEVINSTSQAFEYLNQANRLKKLLEIKLLLIDIVNIRKHLALYERLNSQMDSLAIKYNQGLKRGEVTKLDINKIKIEQVSITREIKSLTNQLEELEGSLLNENGGKDVSQILASLKNYPEEIILSEDDYIQHMKENDPELIQYDLLAKANKHNEKAIEMSKRPGFSIGYKLENELGTYFNGFSIGVSIPLFSHKNKIEANVAQLKAIDLQSNAIEVNRISQIKAQRNNAIALFQELEQYRPILENQDNIKLLKKALDGGQINLITYIQEVNFFIEAQNNYLNVEYNYHKALASLNQYQLLKI